MQFYDRPRMKEEVKKLIRDKWIKIFVCLLIYSAIAGLGSIAFGLGIILATPILIGIYEIMKDVLNGKDVDFNKLFMGYKDLNRAFNFFILVFIRSLFIFLWSLLFIIPGVIVYYSYSQAIYIAVDNPDLDFMEVLRRSKEMMRGHKWELFVFDLSFIGQWLLTAITFGIYGIYSAPYYYTARVRYYQYLNPPVKEVNDNVYGDF